MEIWKPLRNFPSYDGSTEGRIRNIKTRRIMKTFTDERGYIKVCLRKNNQSYTVKAARVLAETFLGEHPDLDVTYKDLDRSNLRINNLEWCTRSKVIQDAFDRGSKIPVRCTPIRVIETDDIYSSVSECARAVQCDKSDIFKYLAGNRDNVRGYHFERL